MLARIDHTQLTRRLTAQREMAVFSQRARHHTETLETQIANLERVLSCRRALAQLAEELPGALSEVLTTERIASLRGRVVAATTELDEAVAGATNSLDSSSFKVERTRHRGIYRSGGKYVVPHTDELGDERRREFATLADALDFRAALRVASKRQTGYTGPSYKGHESTGGGPGI